MIHRIACPLALLIILVTPAVAQSSADYSMSRVAVVSGAASMASTNFSTSIVGPQESPVGGASFCNTGAKTGMGFWSVLGQVSVPIVLTARRSAGDPLDVDLSWSGADANYQIYRAFTPHDVFNQINLDRETDQCSATDLFAFQSDMIFYNVIRRP